MKIRIPFASNFMKGTLILTLAGLITRVIGFFYRIFLSHAFGGEGMGIYQLTAPVMAISYAITCSGIQTAISKYVASENAQKKTKDSIYTFVTGFILSLFLSILSAFILCTYGDTIAANYLLEARCAPLVKIFGLSLPFSCLHCCINGYYYGLKKTVLPSLSQLIEQIARVATVWLLYQFALKRNMHLSLSVAAVGLLAGELFSSIVSFFAIWGHFRKQTCILEISQNEPSHKTSSEVTSFLPTTSIFIDQTKKILSMSVPLSLNRLILSFLQSVEAVYIPNRLILYGQSNKEALSSYGVLTGMTLPLILFPTALTSSIAVLLLPYISEAQAQNNARKIRNAILKCSLFCITLGSFCCIFFLLQGRFLGNFLFHNELAGAYICAISIVCPLLYLGSILTSILHGLGKAMTAFISNTICILIRLLFVFFVIPSYGINGYIRGIFVSQAIFSVLMILALTSTVKNENK